MLYEFENMPKNVPLCRILTSDKIGRRSTPVEFANPSGVQETIWKMVRACVVNGGIGLAAPQIGIFKRVFLVEETPKVFRAYINPTFVPIDVTARIVRQEACLSVPGKVLRVSRFVEIHAQWTEITEDGAQLACDQLLSGVPAKVFQHELDHLDGISILEKSRQVRP